MWIVAVLLIHEKKGVTGYAVVTLDTVIEAKPLPQGTLAQKRWQLCTAEDISRPIPLWPLEIPKLIQHLVRQHLLTTKQQLQPLYFPRYLTWCPLILRRKGLSPSRRGQIIKERCIRLPDGGVAVPQLLEPMHNVRQGPTVTSGIQAYGATPFEDLQVDFTEILKRGGHKYLFVLMCTYSGWVDAFLNRTEKAHKVTCVILQDLIPRFGWPLHVGSDNRPASVVDLVQKMAMALGITWKLHAAY
ncbi:Gag-Pol polyprotein [Plecturocebus cupreus]